MLCSIGPSAQSIRKEFGPRSGETAPGNGPTLFIYSGSGGGRQPSLKQSWKLSRSASYRKLVFRGPCHLRNHDCFRECRFYKSLLTSGRIRWQARRILRCGSCCKTSKANQHTFPRDPSTSSRGTLQTPNTFSEGAWILRGCVQDYFSLALFSSGGHGWTTAWWMLPAVSHSFSLTTKAAEERLLRRVLPCHRGLKRWLFASCSLSRCASSSKPKLQESVALVGDSGLKNAWEELMMLLRQQVGGRAQQANHISMRRTSKRAHRCYSKTVGGVKLK